MTDRVQCITRFAYPGSGRPHWWGRFVRHGVTVVNERFYEARANTSTLRSFELPVIGRYFPEYETTIKKMLG